AFVNDGDSSFRVDGFNVEKVVDTVGAGDGFAVGVISGILEGLSTADAVKRGNAIGAIQVMNVGDNEGLPMREELEKFIEG
ncbi:MAG: PfkB family carbohydrate kinase, partial [Lachnospiraceae bacterium]|nr:PfkB family carbohydrate kinase [Lachnospiraceae bacterium]